MKELIEHSLRREGGRGGWKRGTEGKGGGGRKKKNEGRGGEKRGEERGGEGRIGEGRGGEKRGGRKDGREGGRECGRERAVNTQAADTARAEAPGATLVLISTRRLTYCSSFPTDGNLE